MTTIESNDPIGTGIAIFCVALVVATIAALPSMRRDSQKQREVTPCSAYREATLDNIPAKCITPQGGFKP